MFGLDAELVSARPGQRLPDVALSLFLSLGGHVELPCDKIFINPLPGYVENKAAFAESFKPRRNDPSARAFGSDIPGALGEQGIRSIGSNAILERTAA